MKLLKDNVEELQRCIPLHSISQTFQDAVVVTRKLGFQYLWVDSLCITQDCVDDWRKESALMGDAYKGGICSIAATAASGSGNGLYAIRDPFSISPFTVDISRRHCEQSYLCIRGAVRYNGFIKSPLNRRGRVYQERLLSPRTIHFSNRLFWECRELEAAETYPMGISSDFNVEDQDEEGRIQFDLPKNSWLIDMNLNPDSRHNIWRSIVSDFVCYALAEEGDKLVAISGLVKEITYNGR